LVFPPQAFDMFASILYAFFLCLSLPDNDLDGFLPPEIAEMPALRHLELPANLLSGPLPDGVFNALPLLETLRLQMNQLSGPVSVQ